MLRALSPVPAIYRGFPLHPDDENDPYAFRVDLSEFGIGAARVVFSRDLSGATTAAHLDVRPMSLLKQSDAKNPRARVTGSLMG